MPFSLPYMLLPVNCSAPVLVLISLHHDTQLYGTCVVAVWSFLVSFALLHTIKRTMGLRVSGKSLSPLFRSRLSALPCILAYLTLHTNLYSCICLDFFINAVLHNACLLSCICMCCN